MFDSNCNSGEIASLILNGLSMGLLYCDRQGIIRFINRAYADLINLPPQNALGQLITAIIPHSRAYDVMANGEAEMGQLCKLGTQQSVIVNRIPVKDEEDKICGMISQAIFNTPDDLHQLSARFERLGRKLSHFRLAFQASLMPQHTFASILGNSESLTRLKRQAQSYAKLDEPVLILGQTGSGKELFAHAMHAESPRAEGPLVCINCASIPRELFESELFGYEKGAFSGSRGEGKIGQIELSHNGTLFLDEIGDMPTEIQVKLLRVLENHCITRLGGVRSRPVNFRLMAATNRNLRAMLENGAFREDLYYRINTFVLDLPPLHERPDDIEPIALYTLKRMQLEHVRLAPETIMAMRKFTWPGNARQLRNAVIHAATMRKADILFPSDFPQDTLPSLYVQTHSCREILHSAAAKAENQAILSALAQTGNNVAAAARNLRISRATIYEKMRKYGINPRKSET